MRISDWSSDVCSSDLTPQQQVGLTGRDTHGVDVVLPGGDANMGDHRAEFLRQASLVQHAATLAFDMRGHAEQRSHGRSEARREGQECVRTWRSRWSPYT